MKITFAINSYKNPDMLRLCLREVLREAASLDAEVIVADSETEHDTKMLMNEDFPQVRFFPHQENVGFVRLVNTCLESAQGDFIFLLNSDILLREGTVKKMLAYMESNPQVGILGPKLLNFDGTLQYSSFRFYRPITILYRRTLLRVLPFAKKHLAWFMMKDKDHTKPFRADWIMGSALLVRRSAADDVGKMDSRFFMYMEDVDWCRRFWEKGYPVMYYPNVSVYHYHGKGSAKGGFLMSLLRNRLTWIHIASAMKYFKKYWGKKTPA